MDDVTLTKTICALLADGHPDWVWRETGPAYTADEVGIFYGAIGPTPDSAVGVRLYQWTDPTPAGGVTTRRVQVRYRGPRNDIAGADKLAQIGFDTLHGRARVAGLSLVTRVLVAPLGADQNARQERADSFQIILDNAEASA